MIDEVLVEQPLKQRLDLLLHLVRQLVAVRSEQLDAVVFVRIVRGRDHHAEIGAHGARQHADRRRRDRAENQRVHAHRREARDHGVFDHVARQARVLADDHAMAIVAALEHQSRGLPDLEGELRRDEAVGHAANAVCAEIGAAHLCPRTGINRHGANAPSCGKVDRLHCAARLAKERLPLFRRAP